MTPRWWDIVQGRAAARALVIWPLLASLAAGAGQAPVPSPASPVNPPVARGSGYPYTAYYSAPASAPDPNAAQAVASLPNDENLLDRHSVQSYLSPPPRSAYGGYGNGGSSYGGSGYGLSRLSKLPADCDECPNYGLIAFTTYDSFRGISDDSWQNNGIVNGVNYGTRLGRFSDVTGIGLQLGGSVGVFDWLGTDYRTRGQDIAQMQGFITYGLFRKANEVTPWNIGLVQDWMINSNFGVFGQNPTLSQLRLHLGYATSAWNEFGIWGSARVLGDSRLVPGFGLVSWRPIDQINLFWHYKWGPGGADTVIWVGLPEHDRMTHQGSLGDYIAAAQATIPLADRVAVYNLVSYMHPSSRPGPLGAVEDAWNFTVGLMFYPGRNARSTTVAGRCWMPLLPVANNGLFFVDTNGLF